MRRQTNHILDCKLLDCESGFSLVELLITMAIIGVLTGIVTQSYDMYKEKAQHSSAITLFNHTRTALEGGKIFSESFPDAVMEVSQNGPGPAGGDYGQVLLKSLIIPDKHNVYVRHAANCDDPLCIEDVISVRHCQTPKMATLTMLRSGTVVMNLHAAAVDPCGAG
ncbi:MAG TPA: prepilin-type N-terminal cleavage/methylation domain-containing protein [Oligoflexia bacterium]|nr:prepilin-type N-terminal cleavage/methylation domain-containing protein [Oligoflexia bacterium]HMP47287.1 prepilin-type N-terminal cleavage/methylation domain-containing protein [Oligoflexia bacterium]